VREWWDEAARHVSLSGAETAAYCLALLERWDNTRIRHQLAQIAAAGSQKLPARILPVLRAELGAGHVPPGAARILGAWVAHLRGYGVPISDPGAVELADTIREADVRTAARHALAALDPALADRPELVAAVSAAAIEFSHPPTAGRARR
jgi:fructuronate reductase